MGDYDDERIEGEPAVVQQPTPSFNYNTRVYHHSNSGRGIRGRGNDSNWRSHGNAPNRRNDNQSTTSNRKVLYVPSQTIGRIIGKGGSKIRELQSESDTRIHIGDSNGNDTDVTLTGTDEAISKAEKLINELIEYKKPHPQQASVVQSQSIL